MVHCDCVGFGWARRLTASVITSNLGGPSFAASGKGWGLECWKRAFLLNESQLCLCCCFSCFVILAGDLLLQRSGNHCRLLYPVVQASSSHLRAFLLMPWPWRSSTNAVFFEGKRRKHCILPDTPSGKFSSRKLYGEDGAPGRSWCFIRQQILCEDDKTRKTKATTEAGLRGSGAPNIPTPPFAKNKSGKEWATQRPG